MTRKIVIVIEGRPIPWKAAFVGKRGSFSPRYHEMQIIKSIIREQYQGPLIETAVWVDFFFYMPIPSATSKKRRALMLDNTIRPETTPDRINLGKLYEDCLQQIVIGNDSKIVDGRVAKFYGENPRTEIYIEPL